MSPELIKRLTEHQPSLIGLEQCRQAAKSDSSVMIYGETGTGKELLAQSIHNASRRANGPFLAINCAAIPENLLEGLLFGTEKGAYTGAERRQGYFEQANNGTLLLDELNSMNINLQAKLLRVLQDGMVRRVGGSSEIQYILPRFCKVLGYFLFKRKSAVVARNRNFHKFLLQKENIDLYFAEDKTYSHQMGYDTIIA